MVSRQMPMPAVGTLIKVESSHNNLRTDEVRGTWPCYPEVGKPFLFFGAPLDENASIRQITTSEVKEVDWLYNKILEFKTRYSTYRLEVD